MSQPNILIIVEGEKTEKEFFEQISKLFKDINCKIFAYRTNIYILYDKIKDLGGFENENKGEIETVKLLEPRNKEEEKLLKHKFAYIYLVFDADIQHLENIKSGKDDRKKAMINRLSKLNEMVEYFDNDSNNVGKLFINYPMMESYLDSKNYFDKNYASREISIYDLRNYKEKINKNPLAHKSIASLGVNDINDIAKNQLYKLNKICTKSWRAPTYDEYLTYSNGKNILSKEIDIVKSKDKLYVLNTSIFFYVDYFGKSRYEDIFKKTR